MPFENHLVPSCQFKRATNGLSGVKNRIQPAIQAQRLNLERIYIETLSRVHTYGQESSMERALTVWIGQWQMTKTGNLPLDSSLWRQEKKSARKHWGILKFDHRLRGGSHFICHTQSFVYMFSSGRKIKIWGKGEIVFYLSICSLSGVMVSSIPFYLMVINMGKWRDFNILVGALVENGISLSL